MTSTKPHILVVLRQASWLEWLPEFLDHPEYTTELVIPSSDQQVDISSNTRCDGIVFLSHHSTLQHDARLAESLRSVSRVPVLCHSLSVANLATNKRAMSGVAETISGLCIIPEFSPGQATEYLNTQAKNSVVRKQSGATEGEGLQVFCRASDLSDKVLDWMLQPFIDGLEFSVNMVIRGDRVLAYEPVFKGFTSPEGVHPCRRERLCPWPEVGHAVRSSMIGLAVRYACAIRCEGLVEVEFVVCGSDVFFLEVNPRLSATMRLASLACERSIFAELILSLLDPNWVGGEATATRFGGEIPFPLTTSTCELASLRSRMPLWISSRVSTVASNRSTLRSQLDELTLILSKPNFRMDNQIR